MNKKRLLVLLAFILSILPKRGISKAQRKSLAISESQLGIRKAIIREASEGKTRSRKGKAKRKQKRRSNPRAARAMRYMRSHKVSLKEAWKHV